VASVLPTEVVERADQRTLGQTFLSGVIGEKKKNCRGWNWKRGKGEVSGR